MNDLAAMFSDGLEANGIDAAVSVNRDPKAMATRVLIKGSINGDFFRRRYEITEQERHQIQNLPQHIGQVTDQIARSLKESFETYVEWGDKAVRFDSNGEHEVSCMMCGATIRADKVLQEATHPVVAESTVPKPSGPSIDSIHPQKLRMAMLALLRDECDSMCENSPGHRLW